MLTPFLLLLFSPIIAMTINNTNTTTIPAILGRRRPVCFPPSPDVRRLLGPSCLAALELLGDEIDFDSPRTWIYNAPSLLPMRKWAQGECVIALSAKDPPVRGSVHDVFAPLEIAMLARVIMQRCVFDWSQAGGYGLVGPRQVFEVLVVDKDFFRVEKEGRVDAA